MTRTFFMIKLGFALLLVLPGCGGNSSRSDGAFSSYRKEDRVVARESFEKVFQAIDVNGDGYITREEFHAAKFHRFEEMDSDGNQKLTQTDLSDDPNVIFYLPYDADGNEKVTLEEYHNYYDSLWDNYLDVAGKGKITLEDLLSVMGLENS